MILILFRSNARAGHPSYLIDFRKDRCIYVRGYRVSFAYAAGQAHTKNPTTAGAVCFEKEVELGTALSLAEIWVYQLILAGTDIASIPHLFVVHREPCAGGGFRTVVHFSLVNFHCGLQLGIRPYIFPKDHWWLLSGQRDLNNRYHLRDPNECPRVAVFSRRHFAEDEALEEQLLADAKKWVLANGSHPTSADDVASRLGAYVEDVRAQYPEFPQAKILVGTAPDRGGVQYALELSSDRPIINLCLCPKQKSKPAHTSLATKPGHLDLRTCDHDDIAKWRKDEKIAKHGPGWATPLFAPDLNRRKIYDQDKPLFPSDFTEEFHKQILELEHKVSLMKPEPDKGMPDIGHSSI